MIERQPNIILYLLLTLLCLALYLPGIARLPLVDRDSAHFVQATKQMLETGNFFQIRFQEKTRFQKPPGINWLQALSVKAFSTQEATAVWPYRIPSVLGGLIATLLTFAFVRPIWGKTVAFFASTLLASSLLLTLESHLAVTDASLLACVIAMQGALWRIYINTSKTTSPSAPTTWAFPLLFWFAMSLGFLIKGVTPIFALLTIATLSLCDRNITWLKALKIQWGLPLLILSSSWLLFVSQAEHSNYLNQMIAKDLWPKLISGHESHGGPPGYHLLLLPLTLWPTSLFLWPSLLWAWQYRLNPHVKFMLAWLLPTWIVCELIPTKLPQYILPIFPVLCIFAANALFNKTENQQKNSASLWLRLLYLGWAILGLCLASIFILLPYFLQQPLSNLNIIGALLMIVMTLFSLYYSYRQHFLSSVCVTVAGAMMIYALTFQYFLPSLSPLWLSEKIESAVKSYAISQPSTQAPLLALDYTEPSLVFLIGTSAVKFTTLNELATLLPRTTPHQLILIAEPQLSSLYTIATNSKITLHELTRINGFNYSKGKWTHLILLEKSNL